MTIFVRVLRMLEACRLSRNKGPKACPYRVAMHLPPVSLDDTDNLNSSKIKRVIIC